MRRSEQFDNSSAILFIGVLVERGNRYRGSRKRQGW